MADESPVVAGFAWPEAEQRLSGSLLVGSEQRGKGSVVLFAQDPDLPAVLAGHDADLPERRAVRAEHGAGERVLARSRLRLPERLQGQLDHLLVGDLDRRQVVGAGHDEALAAREPGELPGLPG